MALAIVCALVVGCDDSGSTAAADAASGIPRDAASGSIADSAPTIDPDATSASDPDAAPPARPDAGPAAPDAATDPAVDATAATEDAGQNAEGAATPPLDAVAAPEDAAPPTPDAEAPDPDAAAPAPDAGGGEPCPLPGDIRCNGVCIEPLGSIEHCGGCGNDCTATVENVEAVRCDNGQCSYTRCRGAEGNPEILPDGSWDAWINCDGDRTNGCEAQRSETRCSCARMCDPPDVCEWDRPDDRWICD
ncbi:MAG: hypothetical protein ACYTF3_08195 [Planctomycetota bacterium]